MRQVNYKRLSKYYRRCNWILLLAIIGMICNFEAMINNEGKMPVFDKEYPYGNDSIGFYEGDTFHFAYNNTDNVNFWFLTDIIYLPFGISSIGDVIMFFSFYLYISLTIMAFTKRWGVFTQEWER